MNIRDRRPVERGHRHLTLTTLSIAQQMCGRRAHHIVHPSCLELRHDVLQLVAVSFGGEEALEPTFALGDDVVQVLIHCGDVAADGKLILQGGTNERAYFASAVMTS